MHLSEHEKYISNHPRKRKRLVINRGGGSTLALVRQNTAIATSMLDWKMDWNCGISGQLRTGTSTFVAAFYHI